MLTKITDWIINKKTISNTTNALFLSVHNDLDVRLSEGSNDQGSKKIALIQKVQKIGLEKLQITSYQQDGYCIINGKPLDYEDTVILNEVNQLSIGLLNEECDNKNFEIRYSSVFTISVKISIGLLSIFTLGLLIFTSIQINEYNNSISYSLGELSSKNWLATDKYLEEAKEIKNQLSFVSGLLVKDRKVENQLFDCLLWNTIETDCSFKDWQKIIPIENEIYQRIDFFCSVKDDINALLIAFLTLDKSNINNVKEKVESFANKLESIKVFCKKKEGLTLDKFNFIEEEFTVLKKLVKTKKDLILTMDDGRRQLGLIHKLSKELEVLLYENQPIIINNSVKIRTDLDKILTDFLLQYTSFSKAERSKINQIRHILNN